MLAKFQPTPRARLKNGGGSVEPFARAGSKAESRAHASLNGGGLPVHLQLDSATPPAQHRSHTVIHPPSDPDFPRSSDPRIPMHSFATPSEGTGSTRTNHAQVDPPVQPEPPDATQVDHVRSTPSDTSPSHLFDLPDFFTKLRPGARELLAALKEKYKLYIYTMGDERYACAMANLLDTEGHLFRNRIINRSDANLCAGQKGLEKVDTVPEMTAIVDDTVGARPLPPSTFFTCSVRVLFVLFLLGSILCAPCRP
jgi:hypothetical protein